MSWFDLFKRKDYQIVNEDIESPKETKPQTIEEFMQALREMNAQHAEIYKFVDVIKKVRNRKLAREFNYCYEIQEILETFQLAHNLAQPNKKFSFHSKLYRKTGLRWYCKFDDGPNRRIDICHVPHDSNYSKRIEVIINGLHPGIVYVEGVDYKSIDANYTSARLLRVQFEDSKIITGILSNISDFIDDSWDFNLDDI